MIYAEAFIKAAVSASPYLGAAQEIVTRINKTNGREVVCLELEHIDFARGSIKLNIIDNSYNQPSTVVTVLETRWCVKITSHITDARIDSKSFALDFFEKGKKQQLKNDVLQTILDAMPTPFRPLFTHSQPPSIKSTP